MKKSDPKRGAERRRHKRYPVSVSLHLRWGRESLELMTDDVSFSGLFARTDSPPALRSLVEVTMTLPPGDTPFKSGGMAVFVIPPDDPRGRAPGVGVQFYALAAEEEVKWRAFVEWAKDQKSGQPEPGATDPVRRRHKRRKAVVEVRPTSLGELVQLFTRDVSGGGMFIQTELDLPLVEVVHLDVLHPDTQEVFDLVCAVRRREADGPRGPGVAVEFLGLDDTRREQFLEFVYAAFESTGDTDVELVDASSPELA